MIKIYLSWMFFYIGDAISRVINLVPDDWQDGWFGTFLYRIYSTPMQFSARLQGEDERGPWKKVVEYQDDWLEMDLEK